MGLKGEQNNFAVSERALSLARMVDRLPPGEYVIRLEKTPWRKNEWPIEISREESIPIKKVGSHGKKD